MAGFLERALLGAVKGGAESMVEKSRREAQAALERGLYESKAVVDRETAKISDERRRGYANEDYSRNRTDTLQDQQTDFNQRQSLLGTRFSQEQAMETQRHSNNLAEIGYRNELGKESYEWVQQDGMYGNLNKTTGQFTPVSSKSSGAGVHFEKITGPDGAERVVAYNAQTGQPMTDWSKVPELSKGTGDGSADPAKPERPPGYLERLMQKVDAEEAADRKSVEEYQTKKRFDADMQTLRTFLGGDADSFVQNGNYWMGAVRAGQNTEDVQQAVQRMIQDFDSGAVEVMPNREKVLRAAMAKLGMLK